MFFQLHQETYSLTKLEQIKNIYVPVGTTPRNFTNNIAQFYIDVISKKRILPEN